MDFKNALIPNDNVKICCNKIDINAGYAMSYSNQGQTLTETDRSFLLKFESDRFVRSFSILDNGTKFYPVIAGKYMCNTNSTIQFLLPTDTLLNTTAISVRLVHYDKNDVIIEESNPSYMTYLSGLTYYTTRYTLNCNIIFNINEGDYISVLAEVAQQGSINFSIAFQNTSLEINYINT
jgi:hypothetical protein